ncbi:MAG: glycosyltransferase family 2 protein [Bacteroidota bacterium]
MDKVAIVILNFNGKSLLEKFIPSVIRNSIGYRIFVADNGSTDDSVTFLQNNFHQVTVIRLEKNEGFCKGYNLALQQVDAEYYVLLNSDVEVTPAWVEPLVRLMEANPRAGAVQPKIKSFYQQSHFEHAGAAGGWLDKWGYPFCRGRLFEVLEPDSGQYNDTEEIFWATGACMLVRAALYHELEGLDNDFFAHMEEIDLCWRLQHAGYQVYYCGESEVFHVGGGTLPKSNPRKTFFNFRNGLILLYKNLPEQGFYQTFFIRLVLDGIAGIKFFLEGNRADFWAVIKAHAAFYRTLSTWKAKRKANLARIKSTEIKGVYEKSVVYEHFVKGKNTFKELFG